jgi:hypothetical protein
LVSIARSTFYRESAPWQPVGLAAWRFDRFHRAVRRCTAAVENPTPVEVMAHRLKTVKCRDLYALRKQIPEPVFGIIKSVMGSFAFVNPAGNRRPWMCELKSH